MKLTPVKMQGKRKAYIITSLYHSDYKPRFSWSRFLDRCCEIFFGGTPRGLL